MGTLSQQQCGPCRGDVPPLRDEEIAELHAEVPQWRVFEHENVKRLERVFKFRDFGAALEFTNRVGRLAEQQGHHPAILLEWGRATVTWWTHAIGGLQQNDFVMAAKTDEVYEGLMQAHAA